MLVYRVLTLISSAASVLLALGDYASPSGAVAVLVLMAAWTAATGYLYLRRPAGADRRGRLAVVDLGVTVAIMGTTPLVQTPAQLAADAPVMGSIWTPGARL